VCIGVGVIEKTGPSADRFKIGQRVVALGWGAADGKGTWQQYLAVPESALVTPYPSISWQVNCA
jgi:NADPH:quinone reductase-like Zn-dependent oxidoreductase